MDGGGRGEMMDIGASCASRNGSSSFSSSEEEEEEEEEACQRTVKKQKKMEMVMDRTYYKERKERICMECREKKNHIHRGQQ